MSRIGKKSIAVPAGVQVAVDTNTRTVNIEGGKGKMSLVYRREVQVDFNEGDKLITCQLAEGFEPGGQNKAYWGLTRSLLNNMVEGVSQGYVRKLDIVGVGYGAQMKGQSIGLKLGFSNEIVYKIPAGLDVSVEKTVVTVAGVDKQKVGEFAAKIRNTRKPEPYNGKGVRYLGEEIRRKQGKAFGA